MSLKETIDNKIKDAMRAKDQLVLRSLRAIKSAILLAETAEGRPQQEPLKPEDEMAILIKQAKQRKDSALQFRNANRLDLAENEEAELEIINQFLPKAMSEDEINRVIKRIIAETGAAGMKDMGKVMGQANKEMAGKADGKAISEMVKKLLA